MRTSAILLCVAALAAACHSEPIPRCTSRSRGSAACGNSLGTNLGGIASGEGGRFKVRGRFCITFMRNGDFLVRNERFGITRLGR